MSEVMFDKPRKVYVDWAGDLGDWHWYYWLGSGHGMIRLEGRANEDGVQFGGVTFWVPVESILTMEEVK